MKTWVSTHQPCPCGESSDAFSIDSEGHGFCFSGFCNKPYKHNVINNGERLIETSGSPDYKHKGKAVYKTHRGLSLQTIKLYDIKTKVVDDVDVEVAFPYPTGFKIRLLEKKEFRSEGNMKAPGLFGKDKFDPGSKDSITITEGEWDAPSVYEAVRGETAAVSVRSSSQAKRDCTADRDYINSFKRIYLCFDNDEPGQRAAKEVSSLFDFHKVYHVKLTKYKDASDYFQNGEVDNLEKVWKGAKRYSPDNIISTFGEIEDALNHSREDQIGTYPFKTLQSMTYGLHKGEVVLFKGQEKIGKTEIFRAIEHHILKTTPHNIGIVHLEEDNATTIKGIAGYELGQPAILPDSGLSIRDVFEGYKSAVAGRDDRVFIYQSFESDDEEKFFDTLRFLAAGADCKFIFFDHITWLAIGDEDSVKKLDRIAQRLKNLAKELEVCIIMISHVNESGSTRGSKYISKVANTIIHMERDKTHPDENIRRQTRITVEGVRLGGQTGPGGILFLDNMTYRLRDYDNLNDMPTDERFKVA